MEFTREDKEGRSFIRMEGALLIYEVSKLRDELINSFESMEEVVLELSGITDCDAAGIQLLYAAQKTAGRVGLRFRIEKASAQLLDALRNAGIHSEDILDSLKAENPVHNTRRRKQNGENHYDSG